MNSAWFVRIKVSVIFLRKNVCTNSFEERINDREFSLGYGCKCLRRCSVPMDIFWNKNQIFEIFFIACILRVRWRANIFTFYSHLTRKESYRYSPFPCTSFRIFRYKFFIAFRHLKKRKKKEVVFCIHSDDGGLYYK